MLAVSTSIRPVGALLAALLLSACAGNAGEDSLTFRQPVAEPGQTLASTATPAEVVETLRANGFTDVTRLRDGTVRLRSNSAALVDCGTIVQVALGNRAEFAGNSAKAVLIAKRPPGDPAIRMLGSKSEVLLQPLEAGGGYAIAESHQVRLKYEAPKKGFRSTTTVTFDGTGTAPLADNTACRASGLVGTLLD